VILVEFPVTLNFGSAGIDKVLKLLISEENAMITDNVVMFEADVAEARDVELMLIH